MWLRTQFPADLVTFTEEILNGKLHFLCSDITCNVLLLQFWKKLKSKWCQRCSIICIFFAIILSCLVSTKRSHIFKETCSWKVNTDWAVISKKIITTDSYFFFLVNILNGIISFIRGSLREITTLILSIHLTKIYSRGNLYHAAIVYFQFFILCKT